MYTPNTVLPATGAGALLAGLGFLGALCLLIGVFALWQASGAAFRLIPSRWRRKGK